MRAYCCECRQEVNGIKVKGDVIYPHRVDLYDLEFIQCPICKNYTGRYDGEMPTLPTEYIRSCRYKAHRALDEVWKDKKKRGEYYSFMSNEFKRDFHWGTVKNDNEADEALSKTLEFLKKAIL